MSAVNLGSTIHMMGELATVQRRYSGTTDAYGNPLYTWGGGTWSVSEMVWLQDLRLTESLTEKGWLNQMDRMGYFLPNTVASQFDHVVGSGGSFEIEILRPIYHQGGTIAKQSFCKWLGA